MKTRTDYPSGVPCWVETLTQDAARAREFYAAVLGWEFSGSGPLPDDAQAEYFVARLDGHDVAGLAKRPAAHADQPVAWLTHISVSSLADTAALVRAAGGSVLEGPLDAAPAGKMAIVADAGGAVFALWQAGTRRGAQKVNEPGAWAMSALQTADPDAATAFYAAVFGWQSQRYGPATLFRLPGYVGGTPDQPVERDVVAVMLPASTNTPHWSVDFWTDDLAAATAAAAANGGRVLEGPFDAPPFRQAVLSDPHGARFSLSQLISEPSPATR